MLQEDKAGHFSQRDMNYNVIEAWSAPLNMRSELVKKLKSLILKRALAKYVQ